MLIQILNLKLNVPVLSRSRERPERGPEPGTANRNSKKKTEHTSTDVILLVEAYV
jgi:hypothetical protein